MSLIPNSLGALFIGTAGGAGCGAVAAGFGAFGQGASASGIAKASAIGLLSGGVGGGFGAAAGIGARGPVNAAGINCANGLGAEGALQIGAAEGSVGGFVQGGLTSRTWDGAWQGGFEGGITGAALGGVLGTVLHEVCFVAGTEVLVGIELDDNPTSSGLLGTDGAAVRTDVSRCARYITRPIEDIVACGGGEHGDGCA
jgi:hypothetical protein